MLRPLPTSTLFPYTTLFRSLFDVQREYFESWIVRQKLPAQLGGRWWTLPLPGAYPVLVLLFVNLLVGGMLRLRLTRRTAGVMRSEEHTSELQSQSNLVCRLL